MIYLRQTTIYSNRKSLPNTHHYMCLNTENRDLHPSASPEGARRTPLRGDKRRLQNGTLGTAMRLKTSSLPLHEITRHPKAPMQQKNHKKSVQITPHPGNTMPTCYGAAISPNKGTVRWKLRGPRGAHGNTWACLNSTPPTLATAHKIATQSLPNTWRQTEPPKGK